MITKAIVNSLRTSNRGFLYKEAYDLIRNDVRFKGHTPISTVSGTLTRLYQAGLCDRIKNSHGRYIYFVR